MSKGRKHKKHKKPTPVDESRAKQRAAFKKNKKYILPLIVNTIAFFVIYTLLVSQGGAIMMATLWVYFALTLGFSAAYVIYNRGFSRMNITPEMLPNSMSAEQKEEFIEDGKARLEISKWMLLIIFPLLMTFILDTLNIYILEPIVNFANSIS